MNLSPGKRFRLAMEEEKPLQIVGTIHALCAMMAEKAGFRSIYLSGAGVANASHGLPDLGVTNLEDVLIDARRITAATSIPLLIDIDTGWGNELTIGRAIRELTRAGVAAIHLEDQVDTKRCGHRPGKQLVSQEEMTARVRVAAEARTDPDFFIIARTDAVAVEGRERAIARAQSYLEAGADAIFAEALTSIDEIREFCSCLQAPVLINMTEFGKTPLLPLEDLRAAGVAMVLYPLTAFRAMNHAAQLVYSTLRTTGTQASLLSSMQTRDELYALLNYHQAERKLDLR